jgi:hypothetical protein
MDTQEIMENARYTASPEVLAAHLEGEAVLLHMETKDYFRLNDTAAWIWKGVERGLDRAGLIASLLDRYEVTPEEAEAELDALLADLSRRGLITTAAS